MQPYLQLLAIIYATTNATLKKSFKNCVYLHNKLQPATTNANLKKSFENCVYLHNKLQLVAKTENAHPAGPIPI